MAQLNFSLDAETRAKYDKLYEEIPDFMDEIIYHLDNFVLNTIEDEDIQFFINNQLTFDENNFYYMMALFQCSSWDLAVKIMRLVTNRTNMSENELIHLNFEALVFNSNEDILRRVLETPDLSEEQKDMVKSQLETYNN